MRRKRYFHPYGVLLTYNAVQQAAALKRPENEIELDLGRACGGLCLQCGEPSGTLLTIKTYALRGKETLAAYPGGQRERARTLKVHLLVPACSKHAGSAPRARQFQPLFDVCVALLALMCAGAAYLVWIAPKMKAGVDVIRLLSPSDWALLVAGLVAGRAVGDALTAELSHKWGLTAVVEEGFEVSQLEPGTLRLGFTDPALALRFAAEFRLPVEEGWPEESIDVG
ncbi:MAG: hypothetical protein MUQ10_18955 [Anaerolineae bacterium]|nr:hypothetical protein [Anaerolineae bacterium]